MALRLGNSVTIYSSMIGTWYVMCVRELINARFVRSLFMHFDQVLAN